jgi:protein TonB
VLDVQVLGSGTVGKIEVVSGNAQLAAAAIQAVKQWQYLPYLVDGHAVDSQARITIRFTLAPS